jgi:hypothetical protein
MRWIVYGHVQIARSSLYNFLRSLIRSL